MYCTVLLFFDPGVEGWPAKLIWYLQGEVRHHDRHENYDFTRELKYVMLNEATVYKGSALTQTRLQYFKLHHAGSCIRIPILSDHPSPVEVL